MGYEKKLIKLGYNEYTAKRLDRLINTIERRIDLLYYSHELYAKKSQALRGYYNPVNQLVEHSDNFVELLETLGFKFLMDIEMRTYVLTPKMVASKSMKELNAEIHMQAAQELT